MTEISLVRMAEGHIDSVMEIEKNSFSVPWSRDMFSEMVESPIAYFYVAMNEESKIMGFAGMYVISDEAQIINIAVESEFRRLGIGRRLLSKLIHTCAELDTATALLEVRESNHPARSLYESFGFEFCGMRKKYYTDPVEDALVLQKILK